MRDMSLSEYLATLEAEEDRVRAEIEVLRSGLSELEISKKSVRERDHAFVIDGNTGMKNLKEAMGKILQVKGSESGMVERLVNRRKLGPERWQNMEEEARWWLKAVSADMRVNAAADDSRLNKAAYLLHSEARSDA